MAAKSGKNWNFSSYHRIVFTTLWVKNSLEIAYGFRDIHAFSFYAKIQDGRQESNRINMQWWKMIVLVL